MLLNASYLRNLSSWSDLLCSCGLLCSCDLLWNVLPWNDLLGMSSLNVPPWNVPFRPCKEHAASARAAEVVAVEEELRLLDVVSSSRKSRDVASLAATDGEKRRWSLRWKSDWELSGSALTGWACGTSHSQSQGRPARLREDLAGRTLISYFTGRYCVLPLFPFSPLRGRHKHRSRPTLATPSSSPCAFTSLLALVASLAFFGVAQAQGAVSCKTHSRLDFLLSLLFLATPPPVPAPLSFPATVSHSSTLLSSSSLPFRPPTSFLFRPLVSTPQERRPPTRATRTAATTSTTKTRASALSLIRRHQGNECGGTGKRAKKCCGGYMCRGVRRSLRQDIRI